MKPESPYRILVVDDDEALHGVFSSMLSSAAYAPPQTVLSDLGNEISATGFPTFDIDFALQGRQGLECVQRSMTEGRPYSMAFVDLRMPPGWGGIETIAHIWKECFDLQIVICTGRLDFSWPDLIRQFGHSDRLLVLKKPFDLTEVRQVAYSLAEKWDFAHQARSHLQRLQKLVTERTSSLQAANISLQRKIIENKQAERRLVTQYSVTQALAQAADLGAASEIIFQIVCRSLDWEWGAFWQVDHQANVLRLAHYWHPADASFDSFVGVSRESGAGPGVGLLGQAWSTGKPVWLRDLSQNTNFRRDALASQNGLHSAIGFPIVAGGKIFGVIEFLSQELRERDKDTLQTFAAIGSAFAQFIERKQAEENLKRERDYVGQIIRETPPMVVGIASDGTVTFANPATARHTGYPEKELIGKNWWQLFYPGEEQRQVEQLFRELEKGPVRDYEMVLAARSGQKRIVNWNLLSKYDETGWLAELIGFGNDVTESKQAEVERRVMEMKLRHAQKMESIGQLAAGIAHEINTPTQFIGDNIRFLQSSFNEFNELHAKYENVLQAARAGVVPAAVMNEVDAAARRVDIDFLIAEIPGAIQNSLEGVERVARIVRAMKDFSHPGSSDKTPIDLNRAVETTLTVAANEWKYVAKIALDLDSQMPLVPCLPGPLNQVILNLVVNAAHAIADCPKNGTDGQGLITAQTRLCGDWAEIRIRDTGTGIPEKIRDKIFDPFFTTKPVGKGTGQGLAISHAVIVDQHQGQLTFETEPGVGTVFIIRLPLHVPRKKTEAAA